MPGDIVEKLEKAQPYQSPYGPKSNLLFWLHELARTDRHRTPHVGLGRIATHKVRVGVPEGTVVDFDATVQPFDFIDNDVVIARFTTSRPLRPTQLTIDPGIGIDPEIRDWAGFELKGVRKSLWDRMVMTEIFMLDHIENMARFSNYFPPGGFRTFDP